MKTIAILLVGLSLEVSTLAQSIVPAAPPVPVVAAPAPAVTSPVPAATTQPRQVRRVPRDEQRPARKPAVQNNSPAASQDNAPTPRQNNAGAPRQGRQNSQARSKQPPTTVAAVPYAEALKRQHHERHDRGWWTTHYRVIVLVNTIGYYYWDSGYWYPAYGYDPSYENFDYNGPIYTYGNLLPDQVIYNVQRTLKDLGYYEGPLTGSFSAATRSAISAFQADNGLDATGGIDEPTVEALGLY